ncbi:hypothetical protein [Chromobacterium vaccinii]|uniref:hypothetical protein n=1 Tax=Chromobacterium vaccinii TaxID=1108595 RepID=UPI002F2B65BF
MTIQRGSGAEGRIHALAAVAHLRKRRAYARDINLEKMGVIVASIQRLIFRNNARHDLSRVGIVQARDIGKSLILCAQIVIITRAIEEKTKKQIEIATGVGVTYWGKFSPFILPYRCTI